MQVTANVISCNTPPTLSLPGNITAEGNTIGGANVSYATSASDAEDGALTPSCSPASGSFFSLSTTTVNCSVTDSGGLSISGSFDVTVMDTTAPVVTPPADIIAEATGPAGAVVTYSGEAASDLVDGALTPTCSPASGSTFAHGTTTVTCSATDAAGNTGSTSFGVTVVDTTPPSVTVPADMTVEATSAAGAVATFSASASDLVDGAVTPTCTPASGSTFPLGTTTVNCSATDAAGNTGTASLGITVVDTTPPLVSVPADMTEEATGPSGAAVTFSASASDLVDGDINPTCTPASGSTFPLGTTTVNCSATDAAGNTGSDSFSVSIVDTTPPLVSVPADITAYATGPSGAVISFSASASDLVDGPLTPTCAPASGSTFPLGTTTVSCSAMDAAGNTGSASFNVSVIYNWNGFFSPVNNLPTFNKVKAGSAIPVKFSLNGNMGLNIFAAGYPKVQAIACDTSVPVDAIEETVTAGNSSLSYDAAADQYVYVWKTEKSWTGCRQLTVKLVDGTEHKANFSFTK